MSSFDGRLRLLGRAGFPLGVEVDLSAERMIVTSGGTEVADWALEEIVIASRSDGFHIKAEGEEIVLNITDADRFATEVGLEDI
jgi:hypothetical protein